MVHVSMIGFDDGSEVSRALDGQTVPTINSDLTAHADVTKAQTIAENQGTCFIGPKKAGEFNIPLSAAIDWCALPNPNGRPNSDVLVP